MLIAEKFEKLLKLPRSLYNKILIAKKFVVQYNFFKITTHAHVRTHMHTHNYNNTSRMK